MTRKPPPLPHRQRLNDRPGGKPANSTGGAEKSTLRVRSSLVLLAALVFAAALLIYRAVLKTTDGPERLYLADGVDLSAPPALPDSDLASLRNRFERFSQLRLEAKEHPEDLNIQQAFGVAALSAGDPLSALPALQSVFRGTSAPTADMYDELGTAQNLLGLCDKALATYRQMVQAYPHAARGYLEVSQTLDLLNRRQEAVQSLDSGMSVLPLEDAAGRLTLVNQYDADGDTARAAREARTVLDHSPQNAQAILTTVHFLIKTQHPEEARPLLVDLLAREPANIQAHFEMGVVLTSPIIQEQDHKKDVPAAENELLTAVRAAPKNLNYYNRLGEFYLDLGRYRQCAYVSLQSLTIAPDSAVARLHLADSYAHLGDRAGAAVQGAIAARLVARDQEKANLQMRVMQHPTDPEVNLELARHHEKYGQFSDALPLLESAFTLAQQRRSAEIRKELIDLCASIGIPAP